MVSSSLEYSAKEAAQYLGISVETFYKYVRENKLIMLSKPSGKRYITQDILDSYKAGTLTMEQILNYTKNSLIPLTISVSLNNAKEYLEFSEKNVKYYDVSNRGIVSEFTDLRVEYDGALVLYALGRINKESGTFETVLEWKE